MAAGLKQPVGQKRLTNIAVVKYKKKGKWFEVACYKNKVVDWRNGTETDMDEVLQTTAVFKNVSKGILAKEKDLTGAFGTTDEREICTEILAKGGLQVSEKERKLEYENLFKGIATLIAEKCVDPITNRPFTITMIERAMKDVHFNVEPNKSTKVQAFGEALPLLQTRFSIQRANMRMRLRVPVHCKTDMLSWLEQHAAIVESREVAGDVFTVVCQTIPGLYQPLITVVRELGQGHAHLEMVNLAVQREGGGEEGHVAFEEQRRGRAGENKGQPQSANSNTDASQPKPSKEARRQCKDGYSEVIYSRGPISGISDDISRKAMFLQIDKLQTGWEVELRSRGASGVVDAVFYSPSGNRVGPFVEARRSALMASKQVAQ